MSNKKITWTNGKRKLGDLVSWDRNPRKINDEHGKRLVESFDSFGQVDTIAIGPGNAVYNGHQRIKMLMDVHGPDYEIDVRISSLELSEKQKEKLTAFLHAGTVGEWDIDILSEDFDFEELEEWGLENIQELSGSKNEKLKEESVKTKPYQMTHVLLSVPIDSVCFLQEHIDALKKIPGIEIEQSSN